MSTTELAGGTGREDAERFRRLSAEWKEQVRYLSNTVHGHVVPYQRIIGMGMPVVPLILEDYARAHHWFWALRRNRRKPGAAGIPRQDSGDGQRLDWWGIGIDRS